MLDDDTTPTPTPEESGDQPAAAATVTTRRRRAASRPAGPPSAAVFSEPVADPPKKRGASKKATAQAAAAASSDAASSDAAASDAGTSDAATSDAAEAPKKRTRARKKPVAEDSDAAVAPDAGEGAETTAADEPPKKATKKAAAKKSTSKKTAAKKAAAPADTEPASDDQEPTDDPTVPQTGDAPASEADATEEPAEATRKPRKRSRGSAAAAPLFQAPDPGTAPARAESAGEETSESKAADSTPDEDREAETSSDEQSADGETGDGDGDGTPARRRRRRGGRRRRRSGNGSDDADSAGESVDDPAATSDEAAGPDASSGDASESDTAGSDDDAEQTSGSSRRRRRRRRRGDSSGESSPDDPENTVVKVREPRSPEDEITSVSGSTRLEAKKQRRREGREAGRRRAPIVSEAEFLARRESVKREMVIRQREDRTQIAVLEDGVLVEHYVSRESQNSMIGNVYLGRVQNVLPSMEAAFIDIGKGRNAVLYAGEVDWSKLGDGKPRKIEEVLKSGQTVLVQVTKDPVGHKGARLTSQISLPGRFLVYVPSGRSSGISRKLPDTERARLKALLKEILPGDAGVIIRTAAEGATEEQLTRDVEALDARWKDIEKKSSGSAPQLLYGEPDLMIKVVRDLFNEDFSRLVVEGSDASDMIEGYVSHVAPDLKDRVEVWDGSGRGDVFTAHRIDEQIAKALDRKVWLPSGGSLIIDRTEAMTVVDVNTGKFTGSGGNLEETVTKNNLEAAEEIVRQLRLRDIGGIIVVDFIDMVLESNRDLVLRRLVECLGRDRTRHQVAEVTSLGLVQMTRKRIGTGLLEAFSEPCEHCGGRGLMIHDEPIEPKKSSDESGRRGGRNRNRKAKSDEGKGGQSKGGDQQSKGEQPKDDQPKDDQPKDEQPKGEQPKDEQPKGEPAGEETPAEATPKRRRSRRKPASATSSGSDEAGVEAPGTMNSESADPVLTGPETTP
ncbi:ribonuclease E [Mumia flava]|uniref:Ribonuclease E n=1 Tax=Mumia flava TaxID=1348852 RepID=A0A2M9B7T8_9ACTN|nr:Rne/Rng family ribonuclease [Mumia flava]PJJ53998.1 ribonuclease E [Mumia flava]